jgi:hypothetical protein
VYGYSVYDLNSDQAYRYRACADYPDGNGTMPVCSDYVGMTYGYAPPRAPARLTRTLTSYGMFTEGALGG